MGVAAWYAAEVARFCASSSREVLGALSQASPGDVTEAQRSAWEAEIELLLVALANVPGHLFLEFDVPRLGSRIDAVVVSGAAVVPIEFKVGESAFRRSDYEQAWDYALDLRNFHRGSHAAALFPVLVATEARTSESSWQPPHADGVRSPRRTNAEGLLAAVRDAIASAQGAAIDGSVWGREPYQPTPTIVQAARLLYARHSVDAISRSDASAKNLGATSGAVEAVVREAQSTGRKAIVFVTGVPGAGKTLVGLNIATRHRRAVEEDPTHAVYLSGNAPLVQVLQEALTRDEVDRLRRSGGRVRVGEVRQLVKPFLQNVHHFRDEGLRTDDPPVDHVVVFDEAQRAWNHAKTLGGQVKSGQSGSLQIRPVAGRGPGLCSGCES